MPLVPDTILGHGKQCGDLLNDIAKRNVSHAYLFTGPKHIGKSAVARWFSWRLLSDHLPAEEASSVKEKMERFIHADFLALDQLWIEGVAEDWSLISESSNIPQEHRSKAPTAKTDVISIEDVRALSGRLYETGDSPFLCCVLRSVERMQPAAANAFLKILEEPPPRVVFLLTTHAESLLLPTITSRTRTLRFAPMTRKEMLPFLGGREDDDALFALHIARGAPGILVRLLGDPELLRKQKQLHAQAKQFWSNRSLLDHLQWLMQFSDRTVETEDALLHLGIALREHAGLQNHPELARTYAELLRGFQTNAHRGLLLQRFALEVEREAC